MPLLKFVGRAVNGQELSRSRLDDPVAGEAFRLQCGVSLYNFTSKLSWWYTDPTTGKTTPISDIQPPSGLIHSDYFRSHFLLLVVYYYYTGAKMVKPLRNYTYVEELVWDQIGEKAAGTYGCRASPLPTRNASQAVNHTVTFIVRGNTNVYASHICPLIVVG